MSIRLVYRWFYKARSMLCFECCLMFRFLFIYSLTAHAYHRSGNKLVQMDISLFKNSQSLHLDNLLLCIHDCEIEVSIPWHWFLWLPSNLRFCNKEYHWTVEVCNILRINKLLSKVNRRSRRRKQLNVFFKFKHPNRMPTIEFKVSYIYVNTRDSYPL